MNEGARYIIRSYREVRRDMIKEQAGADQVTRLPRRRIGAAYGAYVITGPAHREAAEYMLSALDDCVGLADEICLKQAVEDEFEVAVEIDYT